ncbi:D-alanine--D-alanine ligase [Enterococcus hulanensis]|uniref:D-alanine--D-alanine ligase family protein n=1 Tax=Enterococcus hulanensis TaxID=2559929 RepID=UPI001A918DBB|nr:D-alanine--D-alanine ligase [Enterococcus hulanensis]MBO0410496.1 D-alanine--D-alanine ligase [Enterococcus hulanensis]
MKIVILAGGKSEERDVSMSSGSKVANALIRKGHQVLLLDLMGNYYSNRTFDSVYRDQKKEFYEHRIPETIVEFTPDQQEIGVNVLEICKTADIVFLALHGGIGENGKLQAIFDTFNIKYTGSGYEASLLAMDKLLFKEIIRFNDIQTADWAKVSAVEETVGISLPAVVKPIDNGSSIGVSIVENIEDLREATSKALAYTKSSYILIEEKIEGREFSVGILGDTPLPVIELKPKAGFYDYQHKYQDNLTEEIVPAIIDDSLKNKMQELALEIHQLLGLSVCSRTDFMVDKEDRIFVIETNSLPGMTPNSLFPQEADATGIEYSELCELIVKLSMEKYVK